jgi:hypothetical protein
VWWHKPEILALGRLRCNDCKFSVTWQDTVSKKKKNQGGREEERKGRRK